MTSENFQERFSQGHLDDEADFMIWSGLYEMLCQNQIQLNELRSHVTQKPKKVSETAIPSEIAAKP